MKDETKLVAVYGSLRKGFGNHYLLKDSKYLGEYDTEPIYDMYSISSFPGLVTGGNTSIKMEVYEVDRPTLVRLNQLEGYICDDHVNNHYNRISINTPYGEAYTYTYNYSIDTKVKVESGDWKTFRENLNKEIKLLHSEDRLFEARHNID